MSSRKKSHFIKTNRRDFIKSTLVGLGGLSLLPVLTSCSTFDEIIFDDRTFLKDQVIIIGGGISGLALAYKLRQLKTEFHLYEGSRNLGGRIKSNNGLDYGASVFQQNDSMLKQLLKELNVNEIALSKTHFYINGGAELLIQALKERIAGLMPYRSLRLRWKMIQIKKIDDKYEMYFETPAGYRTVTAKNVALTIPPSQWSRVNGLLDLPEMAWAKSWLDTLQPESVFKLVTLAPANLPNVSSLNKKLKYALSAGPENLNVVAKPMKNNSLGLEFEVLVKQTLNKKYEIQEQLTPNLDQLLALINAKTKLGLVAKKISDDSYFDWSRMNLIQSAYFKNSQPLPAASRISMSKFQIFGDYSAIDKTNTVEGALQEAHRISQLFV